MPLFPAAYVLRGRRRTGVGREEAWTVAEAKQAAGARRRHQLALRQRESLAVEGVVNVDSFDDAEVVVETDAGVLLVRGQELHIKEVNLETGVLHLTGRIDALEYAGDELGKKSRGFFGKLFK